MTLFIYCYYLYHCLPHSFRFWLIFLPTSLLSFFDFLFRWFDYLQCWVIFFRISNDCTEKFILFDSHSNFFSNLIQISLMIFNFRLIFRGVIIMILAVHSLRPTSSLSLRMRWILSWSEFGKQWVSFRVSIMVRSLFRDAKQRGLNCYRRFYSLL